TYNLMVAVLCLLPGRPSWLLIQAPGRQKGILVCDILANLGRISLAVRDGFLHGLDRHTVPFGDIFYAHRVFGGDVEDIKVTSTEVCALDEELPPIRFGVGSQIGPGRRLVGIHSFQSKSFRVLTQYGLPTAT